jgi:hypothetical protein
MATFLHLCQQAARDSGTVSGIQPSTVVGQTGWLGVIVAKVAEAWVDIQNSRGDWLWMQGEFPGDAPTAGQFDLLVGVAAYTPASFNLSDVAAWRTEGMSLYPTSGGRADEQRLIPLDWGSWRRLYDFGAQTASRPLHVAVRPRDNALCFGPAPAVAYSLRGEYRKVPQMLAVNGDIPAMPDRFHDIIVKRALVLIGQHDEAPAAVNYSLGEYRKRMGDLERDQLPTPYVDMASAVRAFGV